MILKILTVVYAWAWNVEPWTPNKGLDWSVVVLVSILVDPLASIGIGIVVREMIRKIKRGVK